MYMYMYMHTGLLANINDHKHNGQDPLRGERVWPVRLREEGGGDYWTQGGLEATHWSWGRAVTAATYPSCRHTTWAFFRLH